MASFSIHCGCSRPETEDSPTFDPTHASTIFSLFDLDDLYFCENCLQLRCPRCVLEEIVGYYCPSCLHEVLHSKLRTKVLYCPKSCSTCPRCLSVLKMVQSLDGYRREECLYCHWHKPIDPEAQSKASIISDTIFAPQQRVGDLILHYKKFISNGTRKERETSEHLHKQTMTGAQLNYEQIQECDQPKILDLEHFRVESTEGPRLVLTTEERNPNLSQYPSRLIISKTPNGDVPGLQILRSKRAKRCRACRHILTKPDSRILSTRFRIKLMASNYLPSFMLTQSDKNDAALCGGALHSSTIQIALTLTNPLLEAIEVGLATPRQTPGTQNSITLLNPELEIGANVDIGLSNATSKLYNAGTSGVSGLSISQPRSNQVQTILEITSKISDYGETLSFPIFVRVVFAPAQEGEKEKSIGFWQVLKLRSFHANPRPN